MIRGAHGLLAALAVVAGCDELGGAMTALGADRDGTNRGIAALSLFDGAAIVRGPDGYCIDRQASRARTGFAVLAACARVSDAELLPTIDGLVTVQFSNADTAMVSGNESTLASLLEDRDDAEVEAVDTSPGLVVLRYADDQPSDMDGVGAPEWRAFLDIGTRSVTISVRPFDANPLTPQDGEILVRATANALRDANSGS